MSCDLTIAETAVLIAAGRPGGLVLPTEQHFAAVHVELWRKGMVRLFSPRGQAARVEATAAGLRAIGSAPVPLRAVQ